MRNFVLVAAFAAFGSAGCAGLTDYSTPKQGYWFGCESGYSDASWPGKMYIPVPAEASQEFRDAWERGYKECLDEGLRFPRDIPGSPGI